MRQRRNDDTVEVGYWWVLVPSYRMVPEPPGGDWLPFQVESREDLGRVLVYCRREHPSEIGDRGLLT